MKITIENGVEVEFGKVGKLKDYFLFEAANPNPPNTLINAFFVTNLITKFGYSKFASIDHILGLYTEDFDYILSVANDFSNQNGVPTLIDENTIKLIDGFKIGGNIYDIVELGERAKTIHRAEAEKGGLTPAETFAYFALKEIKGIRQSQGDTIFDGEITLSDIGELSLTDGMHFTQLANQRRLISQVAKIASEITSNTDVLESEIIQ